MIANHVMAASEENIRSEHWADDPRGVAVPNLELLHLNDNFSDKPVPVFSVPRPNLEEFAATTPRPLRETLSCIISRCLQAADKLPLHLPTDHPEIYGTGVKLRIESHWTPTATGSVMFSLP